MVLLSAHSLPGRSVWEVVRAQDGVIAHWQLLALGYSKRAIEHRLVSGRLYCLYRGVYAVGRAQVSDRGRLTAALLACGDGATLSHESAAAVWGIRRLPAGAIDISIPYPAQSRHEGIRTHRRRNLRPEDRTVRSGLPLTSITTTLIDLATRLGRDSLEAAINTADKLDHIDPETLRTALTDMPRRPGLARLRRTLDAPTFTVTDSELERRFLPIARRAGLPRPQTITAHPPSRHRTAFAIKLTPPREGRPCASPARRFALIPRMSKPPSGPWRADWFRAPRPEERRQGPLTPSLATRL